MQITIDHSVQNSIGLVRDQGLRPTCLACASSDAHAARFDEWTPMSCEYLYYHAIQYIGGEPMDGATIPAISHALKVRGQPYETEWPYMNPGPLNNDSWKPPSGIENVFKCQTANVKINSDSIKNQIVSGILPIIAMMISDGFYSPVDNVIDTNEPYEDPRLHAVLAVGIGHANDKEYVQIRNSWGDQWGDQGYAWVSGDYLLSRRWV